MASTSTRGAAALVLLLLVIVGTSSVVEADCTGSPSELSTCYSAVMKDGSPPSTPCCDTLKSWGMPCLCSVVQQYAKTLPSDVDVNEVLALPKECKVPGSAGFTCDGKFIRLSIPRSNEVRAKD